MLDSYRKGYGVLSEDLTGISFESESLEECKKYCREGYVIAERIPYVSGFIIRIYWGRWYKPISFRWETKNIFWLHWSISKMYFHKTGKILFTRKNFNFKSNKKATQ